MSNVKTSEFKKWFEHFFKGKWFHFLLKHIFSQKQFYKNNLSNKIFLGNYVNIAWEGVQTK